MKLALFICYITTIFIFSCSSETTTSGTINWWCGQTPHHERCNYYFGQRNLSSIRPISTKEFLNMTVRVAIDHAGEVLKQAQGIEAKYPNVPGKSLWSSCVDYFDGVVFTLNTILDNTLNPTPLDVQTWLSASLAHINFCQKGFEFINMTNTILPVISTNLTELILNSLAISVLIKGSKTPGVVDWNFREEYKLSDFEIERPNVVVAKDGSGNFTTVQEAVDSAADRTWRGRYVIYVKAGVYNEIVVIPATTTYVKMYGDGINRTIITNNQHSGGDMLKTPKAGDLKSSATFQVWGRGFIARDITFQNTAGPKGGQALALYANSDQSAFYHCSIEGYQDTLLAYAHKQFYKECQIFGTIDFICGDGLVVFQDCEIFFRKPILGQGLIVTAQARKHHNESSGFSFQGCNVTAADDLKPVIHQYNKAYLGRPWFRDAVTVFMESFLDDLINPKGWLDSWGYKQTAIYAEYNNNGPGSSTDQRVSWPNYQDIKHPNDAKRYTVAGFMAGDQWLPYTGIPFIPWLETSSSQTNSL